MSIWLHWTCDCISKACVDITSLTCSKICMFIRFGPLFAEGLKHSTTEVSVSVNVSQNTLLSVSFFFISFDLLNVKAWQRHLTSFFHVFVSRQRWVLCLSFKVWGLPFFTIHECTNLHLWGVRNAVCAVGLWQGTKKSWNIQSGLWGRCLSSTHCLPSLARESWIFSELLPKCRRS